MPRQAESGYDRHAWSVVGTTIIGDDILPFASVGAGDHGDNGLAVTQVENLVRHARLNVNEIARLVVDDLRQTGAILMANPALENVEHHVEIDVYVCPSHTAGRNRGDVHGKVLRPHVFG